LRVGRVGRELPLATLAVEDALSEPPLEPLPPCILRRSGHVIELRFEQVAVAVEASGHGRPCAGIQYSSGNKIVVTLRSPSVMIQIFTPVLSVYEDRMREPSRSARSLPSQSAVEISPQSPLRWRRTNSVSNIWSAS